MEQSLLEFRTKYHGYHPWNLARVRGDEKLWEFVSFPWEDRGSVYILARPIGDSTKYRQFEVRKEIAVCQWGAARQKAYKQGFEHGYRYAVAEVKAMRETKPGNKATA